MNLRAYTPLILGIIVMVAVLGLPLMMASPMHEELGCPFSVGQAALCSMGVLEHVTHWQIAFAAIFAELLVVAAFALVAFQQWELAALPERSHVRIRIRSRAPYRPTLFQELFAQGVIHSKAF